MTQHLFSLCILIDIQTAHSFARDIKAQTGFLKIELGFDSTSFKTCPIPSSVGAIFQVLYMLRETLKLINIIVLNKIK